LARALTGQAPGGLMPADSSPLTGLRVAVVAHSPAAATVGLVLAELGASVSAAAAADLDCGACLIPAAAHPMFAFGTPLVLADGVVASFDLLVDDAALCLQGSSDLPSGLAGSTQVRITPFDAPADGGEPRRGTPYTAECAAGVAVALGSQHRSPLRLPSGVSETVAGLNATAAALALLVGGRGTLGVHSVEVSVASALEYLVGMNTKMFEGYPRQWRREGRRSAGSSGPYPLAIFEAADGLIGMVGRSRSDWESILAAMGEPAWAQGEDYRDPFRVAIERADEVDQYVAGWTQRLTVGQIVELSHEFGFVAAPVLSLKDAMALPQLAHRGFWRQEDGALAPTMGLPMRRFVSAVASAEAGADGGRRREGGRSGARSATRVVADPRQLLAGIRVLDFTWVWSGPMVTGILASLGAEVIKVEHPARPDGARMRGRPTQPDGSLRPGPEAEVTPYFHQNGAGKLSLGANLADDDALALLRHLARDVDVVVENMRPGTLVRKGLGYGDLAPHNEQLVMLSMSVAGLDGPMAHTRGYATVMSGLAGYESLIGYGPEDITGGYTFAIADPIAGLFGAIGVLASLVGREREGGSFLDMSQLEAIMHALRISIGDELSGRGAQPEGVADARLPEQRVFPALGVDAWVGASFGTAADVERFTKFVIENVGQPAAGQDVWDVATAWSATCAPADLVAVLEANGAMAAPVVAWPDDASRRAILGDEASDSIAHPFGGRERIFVPPWRIDGARPGFTRRAPLLGEHTRTVLDACSWSSRPPAAFHEAAVPLTRSSVGRSPCTAFATPADRGDPMSELTFRAYQVAAAKQPAELVTLTSDDLADGELLVRVTHSSLNYKDGLAMLGRPGVVRSFPLTCGVDLAGEVVNAAAGYSAGDLVVLTGAGLSETAPGGFSEYQRISSDSVVPAPVNLGTWGAMAVGTAGFTAMLCVLRLEAAGLTPGQGPVLVTGATGGVGSFAVWILSRLGYDVHAVTGKSSEHDYLLSLGAAEVLPREEFTGPPRPLARERWAAAVDCVGGLTLANVLSQTSYAGSIATCGLAGGHDLPATVMPFILRNVSLLGVDSVRASAGVRREAWGRLDALFTAEELKQVAIEAAFEDVPALSAQILAGEIRGRVVVRVQGS
jgi:acrylyl-CoA reductase (NADPH)